MKSRTRSLGLIALLSVFSASQAQYRPQAPGDSSERYAKMTTKDTKCTMLYDSTEVSKSDAFAIVALLEKEGLWSERTREAKGIFAVTKYNAYSVTLFVAPKAISSLVADSVFRSLLHELKWIYPERRYEFSLMSFDSTFAVVEKKIKLE